MTLSTDFGAIFRRALKPEPQTLVSAWADAKRVLPPTAAEPGRYRTSRVPYLREIMDCLSVASPYETVVFMKPSQIGATEAALNFAGYVIENAPGVLLFVNPTDSASRRNVRLRVDPLIDMTPELKALVTRRRSRQAGNNDALKVFPGGQLSFVGANSAVGLRSTPARYLICDEVDAFPADASGEGDPVTLAKERTQTFAGRKKVFLLSTPTIAGASRIETAFKQGDQRKYAVPCPFCGVFQTLHWNQTEWPEGDRTKTYYVCEECGEHISERHKPAMVANGRWVATAKGDGRTASFHLNALYSPFITWSEIALKHAGCGKDPYQLQAWTNSTLGEVWEDVAAVGITPDVLLARASSWGNILPDGVVVLVCGVDVQIDRLELEIVGFGKGEQSWSIDYVSVPGSPADKETWQRLDAILLRKRPHRILGQLPIAVTCVDSGMYSKFVYEFCGPKFHRKVFAVKGSSIPTAAIWPRRPSRPTDGRPANLFNIGVTSAKATTAARLKLDTPGPGYCNFPERDLEYFEQLLAEKPVRKLVNNVPKIVWFKPPHARNEAFDARNYALAALHALKSYGFNLDREADRVAGLKPLDPGAPSPKRRTMADFGKLNSNG